MKNLLKLNIYIAVIASFVAVQFAGCTIDKVEPDDSTPVSDFEMEADNGMNAPSSIQFQASFSTSILESEYHWDFGNGDTSTGYLVNYTYYKPGNYTVSLSVKGPEGSSQTSKEITIGELDVQLSFLEGTWSIVRQEVTMPGSSTPIITEREMNWETLDYSSNGRYNRLSLVWVEKESGACSVSNNILTQTPDNSSSEGIEILITSVSESIVEAEATIIDPEAGTIIYKITLQKNGPEYGHYDPSFPNHFIQDGEFFNTTWSILEETTKMMTYSSATDEYSDVVSAVTESNIDHNCNNFISNTDWDAALWIDNWYNGVYQYYHSISQISGGYGGQYWIDPNGDMEGDEIILQVVNNEDNNNLDMVSVWFEEVDGVNYKFENHSKFKRNDGTEAIISKEELAAKWEITAKIEKMSDSDVNPAYSGSPPIGFVLTFNIDGWADLGDVTNGSWFVLNESNFIIASPEGDEVLVHVSDYDSNEGELKIFTITSDSDTKYLLSYTLQRVED